MAGQANWKVGKKSGYLKTSGYSSLQKYMHFVHGEGKYFLVSPGTSLSSLLTLKEKNLLPVAGGEGEGKFFPLRVTSNFQVIELAL